MELQSLYSGETKFEFNEGVSERRKGFIGRKMNGDRWRRRWGSNDGSTVRQIEPAFRRFTIFLKKSQCTTSQPAIDRWFVNLIGDPPVGCRLGFNASVIYFSLATYRRYMVLHWPFAGVTAGRILKVPAFCIFVP
ncbi:hypothetical protein HAX54_038636 [Datura stramonium]|uniref:Uncharacterized protein n=1 Tax=Datura stramonium TaxID=4076 RepID=A0ABS8SIC3_DATST|nr:hypothetical protein [Datura stramonium]